MLEQLGPLLAPVAGPVAAGGAEPVEAGEDVEGVRRGHRALLVLQMVDVRKTEPERGTHRPGSRIPRQFHELDDRVGESMLQAGGPPPGLLAHVVYPVADGFVVAEVWRAESEARAYVADVLTPLIVQVGLVPATRGCTRCGRSPGPEATERAGEWLPCDTPDTYVRGRGRAGGDR